MNQASENLITLRVDGLESERGHVTVDEFLERLTHLLNALNGIDKLVGDTGSPRLYYRIVNAKHDSPLQITLEPVLKKPSLTKRDYADQCHTRFFQELNAIKRRERVSEDIDTGLLEHLHDLAMGVGRDFKRAVISNGTARVELDKDFEDSVRRLVAEQEHSYGAFEGMLEAVNIHGGSRRFWLYPKLGPKRVRCDFLPGTSEQLREALGHHVRIVGLKYFRAHSPFPYRISVKEFEVIDDESAVPLHRLGGISPDATGKMTSVEFVRKIRNEWD